VEADLTGAATLRTANRVTASGAASLCVTYSLLQHDAAIGWRINCCMNTSSAPHEICIRSPILVAARQRCLVAELFPRAFEVPKGCSRHGASDWTAYASGDTPHTSGTLVQIQRDAPEPKTTVYCHCCPMTEVATLRPYACQHVFRSRAPSESRHAHQCKAICAANTKPSKHHISMCTNKTCKKQGCQQVT